MNDKCMNCVEKCPQAEYIHNTALGRMYATNELISFIKRIECGELEEVRHGKWIPIWDYDHEDNSKWIIGYQCSLCDGCVGWLDNNYNRCPHCGAKMSE